MEDLPSVLFLDKTTSEFKYAHIGLTDCGAVEWKTRPADDKDVCYISVDLLDSILTDFVGADKIKEIHEKLFTL